jgi:putative membrane protein
MKSLLVRFLVIVLGILFVAHFVPGIEVSGLYTAVIVAILWGLVNIFVKPVLFILTLPLSIITLGLFVFVLNALLFWFVSTFVEGFTVDGFLPALIGTLIITLFSWVSNRFI